MGEQEHVDNPLNAFDRMRAKAITETSSLSHVPAFAALEGEVIASIDAEERAEREFFRGLGVTAANSLVDIMRAIGKDEETILERLRVTMDGPSHFADDYPLHDFGIDNPGLLPHEQIFEANEGMKGQLAKLLGMDEEGEK
jgi:hypothetical protein